MSRREFPTPDVLRERCQSLPGACILDVSADNICDYACGAWALVERDIRHVLPDEATAKEVIEVLTSKLELPQAFGLRSELCNLKKCTFYVLQQASNLERLLSQLASFWHGEHDRTVEGHLGFWMHSTRLENISDARTQAKGAASAVADARSFSKHCCSLPRHPSKQPAAFLRELPMSLQACRIASAALAAAASPSAKNVENTAAGVAAIDLADGSAPDEGACAVPAALTWHARAAVTIEAQAHWPAHIKHFVSCMLICRGADKALRIRDEASRVEAAMITALKSLEASASVLAKLPTAHDVCTTQLRQLDGRSSGAAAASNGKPLAAVVEAAAEELLSAEGTAMRGEHGLATVNEGRAGKLVETSAAARLMSEALRRRRHANLVAGALPVMRDTLLWLRAAFEAAESGSTRFVAGDARLEYEGGGGSTRNGDSRKLGWQPALCVWPSTKLHGHALFARLAGIEATYRPQMRAQIQATGWPSSIVSRRGMERPTAADNKVCTECRRQFSSLWVHRGVCSECEAAIRKIGSIKSTGSTEAGGAQTDGNETGTAGMGDVVTGGASDGRGGGVAAGLDKEAEMAEEQEEVDRYQPFMRGRCPYSQRCQRTWFCPHHGRCLVCDSHSCAACRLERGGAEAVEAIAHRMAFGTGENALMDGNAGTHGRVSPSAAGGGRRLGVEPPAAVPRLSRATKLARIALDWDRTLCTTRSGGEPVVGKHHLDEELCALLWQYDGLCEIVTRNGHTAAIRAFLASNGAPEDIPIRTVRKGQSKADFILAGLEAEDSGGKGEQSVVLFVDDSVAELVDPRLTADPRVHRVLFVRALL